MTPLETLFSAPQRTNPPALDARIYDKVKVFLLFIGYNRSRHTLLASLLDAHPNVIIANDFNILGEWINNPLLSQRKKYYMYELLYAKSRYDVMYGVRSRMVDGKPAQYHYNIKGLWQGQYNKSIQVNGAYKFNPVISYSFHYRRLFSKTISLIYHWELSSFLQQSGFLTYIIDHHEIQTLCI